MKALEGYVIVENIEEAVKKVGVIELPTAEKPRIGHYKVLSSGHDEIKENDFVWIPVIDVIFSSNFENEKIGIVKADKVMAKD